MMNLRSWYTSSFKQVVFGDESELSSFVLLDKDQIKRVKQKDSNQSDDFDLVLNVLDWLLAKMNHWVVFLIYTFGYVC